MKRFNLKLLASAAALVLAAIACEFSFSSAGLENVGLALDENGTAMSTSFGQQDIIYLVGELSNAPDDTHLKTTWLALEVADIAPETVIDEAELTTGSGAFNFSLEQSSALWPPGKYRVDLYLNDELFEQYEYEVKQTIPPVVERLRLAQDAQGDQSTLSFSPEDTIFLRGDLKNSPGSSLVRVVWSALQAQGELLAGVIDQQEQSLGSGPFSIKLQSGLSAWPEGSYSVDVFLDEILVQTLEFQVQGAAETGSGSLENIYTAWDSDGVQASDVFAPKDTFYVIADLVNAPQGAQVNALWKAESVPGFEPDEVISEPQVFEFEEGSFSISLANDQAKWTEGAYAVEMLVNGVSAGSHRFMVTKTRLSDVFMAYDQAGERQTEVFGTADPFYVLFTLENAPEDTKVSTRWLTLNEESQPDDVLNVWDYTFGSGGYYVELTTDSGTWLSGSYAVQLYLQDYLYQQVDFSVE